MSPDKAELKTWQFVLLYLLDFCFCFEVSSNPQSTADSDELYDSLSLSPFIDY